MTERMNLSARAVEQLTHCNKCGFCLPACPTYLETGCEVHSPRGRLSLIEAAWRGELAVGDGLVDALGQCIGCRACETACPSGVRYGVVLEAAREDLRRRRPRYTVPNRMVEPLLALVKRRRLLRAAAGMGRAAAALPLPTSLAGFVRLVPPRAVRRDGLPPPHRAGTVPVHLVGTCVMASMFPDANRDARWLLQQAGARLVGEGTDEGCCGALHAHAGDAAAARRLARAQVMRWERELPPDAWLVSHAGGCSAMMADYGRVLKDDPACREPARRWASKVRDFADALLNLPGPLRFQGDGTRVALQNSCHLVNALGSGAAPAALLQSVAGDTFVALPGQDRCCGSGGLYNLNQPAMADRILGRHLDEVQDAGVDVWIMNNPGCALHADRGIRAQRRPVAVRHLASYLAERWVAAE